MSPSLKKLIDEVTDQRELAVVHSEIAAIVAHIHSKAEADVRTAVRRYIASLVCDEASETHKQCH